MILNIYLESNEILTLYLGIKCICLFVLLLDLIQHFYI